MSQIQCFLGKAVPSDKLMNGPLSEPKTTYLKHKLMVPIKVHAGYKKPFVFAAINCFSTR